MTSNCSDGWHSPHHRHISALNCLAYLTQAHRSGTQHLGCRCWHAVTHTVGWGHGRWHSWLWGAVWLIKYCTSPIMISVSEYHSQFWMVHFTCYMWNSLGCPAVCWILSVHCVKKNICSSTTCFVLAKLTKLIWNISLTVYTGDNECCLPCTE